MMPCSFCVIQFCCLIFDAVFLSESMSVLFCQYCSSANLSCLFCPMRGYPRFDDVAMMFVLSANFPRLA